MRENMKKLASSVLFCLAMLVTMSTAAYAANEKENNNSYNKANTLTADASIKGIISSSSDVDFYQYTVAKSGYFDFYIKDVDCKNPNLYITIYNSNLKEIATSYTDEFKNGNKLRILQRWNFAKGTKLYIKIEPYYYNLYNTYGTYELSVKETANSSWEQENGKNDTKKNPTKLSSNKKKYGTLTNNEDIDFYKYKVDITGHFEITVTNEDSANARWKIQIYDSKWNEIDEYTLNSDSEYAATSMDYNFKKGTTVYVKISDDSYYGSDTVAGDVYSIKVTAKKSSNYESEGNNKYSQATKLTKGKKVTANLYVNNDKDYYVYKATKKGTTKVGFYVDVDDESVGNGWKAVVYDSSKKKVKTISNIKSDTTFSFKTAKNKNYYIVISAQATYSSGYPTGIPYAVKVK